ARLKHQGKTYESQPLTLRVLAQDKKNKLVAHETNKSNQASEIFCRLETNKKNVVVGEAIPLALKIYVTGSVSAIKQIALPEFNACSMKKNSDDFKQYKQTINNQTYTVHEKEFVLFPTKAGSLQINPAQVVYVKQRKQRRSFGFFDEDFFSAFEGGQRKAITSNSLTINVKALPDMSEPDAYEPVDGIGTFQSFLATIDKNNVLINEPIKLTLTINGNGNFDLIAAPKLTLPKQFKSYDSKSSKNQTHEDSLTSGTKSFEYILQVPSAGEQIIPSQKFVYFDIVSKTYKTIATDSIPITITTPVGATSYATILETDTNTHEQEIKPLSKTIHFIQEDVPSTKKTSRALSLWFFILLILIAPLLFFMKKVSSLLAPILSSFSSGRKNLLPAYQAKLAILIKKERFQDFYTLFINFLAQISGQPEQNIDQDGIARYLLSCGMKRENIEAFLEHLNQCALFSFGSKQIEQADLKTFYKTSKRWLDVIDQQTKKHRGQS
ncbi:protein BatD, partial [Candidatus Babeliales bacterium]|nr:protein BatD [Candidatus Babeliales bacterium]